MATQFAEASAPARECRFESTFDLSRRQSTSACAPHHYNVDAGDNRLVEGNSYLAFVILGQEKQLDEQPAGE
jgi:hypothetical protein